jgi:hypothetical protein
MNTKILLASLATAGLASAFGATAAHAEGIKLGGQLQVLPASELEGENVSIDLKTSLALVGTFDYAVHPNIDVGAAPRIAFGLKPEEYDGDESLTQFDLAARVTGHTPVGAKVEVFGFVSPGYSIISSSDDDDDSSTGLILGLGGGAAFAVTPTIALVGELGYTLGFQSVDGDKAASNLLHLGFGVQAAL